MSLIVGCLLLLLTREGDGITKLADVRVVLARDCCGADDTSFGYTVAFVGDINLDGVEDFAVGAPGVLRRDGLVDDAGKGRGWDGKEKDTDVGRGRVVVLSGADASLIKVLAARERQWLGHNVCGVGDWNGDGVPDLAVSSYGTNASPAAVEIVSGQDLASIKRFAPEEAARRASSEVRSFGWSLAACSLANSRPRILVGAPLGVGSQSTSGSGGLAEPASAPGRIYVFSDRQAEPHLTIRGEDMGARHLGYSVTSVSDIDGDGVEDLAAGCALTLSEQETDCVVLLSGSTGRVIRKIAAADVAGSNALVDYGSALCFAPAAKDRRAALLIGAPSYVGAGAVCIVGNLQEVAGSVLKRGAGQERLGSSVAFAAGTGGEPGWVVAGTPDAAGEGTSGAVVVVDPATGKIVGELAGPKESWIGQSVDVTRQGQEVRVLSGGVGTVIISAVPRGK